MSIYLGDSGAIELRRDSLNVPISATIDPDDVNVDRRRFSFDFPSTSLITGDKIEIATKDKSDLQLVAGHTGEDGRWYIHVDSVGGLRLYDSFASALAGKFDNALKLIKPTKKQEVTARTYDTEFRCIGQVREYSFTSSRETLDLTGLGEEFRRNYADGLISGQGSLTCFWEYRPDPCEGDDNNLEFPNYLAQLTIRTQLGSDFTGRFYLTRPSSKHNGTYLWYEAECIITNCSTRFAAGEPVVSQIDFVTTSEFVLRMGTPPSNTLQESGSRLLQESGEAILLANND